MLKIWNVKTADASVNFFQVPTIQAQQMAKEIVNKCVQESKEEGTYGPERLDGERILRRLKDRFATNPELEEEYRENLAAGVTDDDYVIWYGQPSVERRISVELMNRAHFALYIHRRTQGDSEQAAKEYVVKHRPLYGDPSDERVARKQHRPLPIEVLPRAQRLLIEGASAEGQKELSKHGSFNALFRARMQSATNT